MQLRPSSTETIKAKADRYYMAQCKRLAAERKTARMLRDEAHSCPPALVVAAYEAVVTAPASKRKRVTKKVIR